MNTGDRLAAALGRVIKLRRELRGDAPLTQRWLAVKTWQAQRLRETYPDLLESARYAPACEFFLDELYGVKDFEQRDQEALRIGPKLARLLPQRAVETMAMAVELDELSETLDSRLAAAIEMPIDAPAYAEAYRTTATRAERQRQIDEVHSIGQGLERLARVPLLTGMLHMMRGPAEAAGLSHLHRFLQTGFDAFKKMGSAAEFLDIIRSRETALMDSIFAGCSDLLQQPGRLIRE